MNLPYRIPSKPLERSVSFKEKIINMFFKIKTKVKSFAMKHVVEFIVAGIILSITGFIIWAFCDAKKEQDIFLKQISNLQQTQRHTVQKYATAHNMRVVSCLDVSGYCECSAANETNFVVIRVIDEEPKRVFSVIQSLNFLE